MQGVRRDGRNSAGRIRGKPNYRLEDRRMRLFARSPRDVPDVPARAVVRDSGLGQITYPPDAAIIVSRLAALELSVIANAHRQICGIAGQLTVDRFRGDEKVDPGTILTQPDPDTTWPAMIGATIDDLIFYGESFWLVLRRDAEGFPTRARLLPWPAVYVRLSPDYGKWSRIIEYAVAGSSIPPRDVIRFKMAHSGILRDEARILLDALALEAAARRFIDVPLPAGVLTNTGQEMGDDEARQLVAAFDLARQKGSTAFLQSITYERTALNSADLQLIEAQARMDTKLARLMNAPVSMVGASPTGTAHSQTYANVVAGFTQLVQQTIAPYLRVVEDTFSLAQVTPRGQRVAFDTGDWLRFAQVAAPSPGLNVPVSPGGTEAQ